MDKDKLGLDDIRELVDWINENQDIQEFSLKYEGLELVVSRVKEGRSAALAPSLPSAPPAGAPPVSVQLAAPSAPAPVAPPVSAAPAGIAPKANEVLVKAPMVGIFYASPKPDAPPFVAEGQAVGPDSVLCIIEVMKLMQSIQAHESGVIEKIFVTNGQAVQYGEPLMLIRKT
jgi:acetyl-CoA carboxylase biotin carboxyl carrier protein